MSAAAPPQERAGAASRPLPRGVRRLLLALLALFAALAVAEVALRAREASPPPVFEHKGKGRIRRADSHPELAPLDVAVVPDRLRIVYMGASTVLGVPYEPKVSPPHWLELVLRARGVDAEVVTVAGTGLSAADLARIFPDVLELKPRAIVLDTGHNEFLKTSALLDRHWWDALRVARKLEAWCGGDTSSGEELPEPGRTFDEPAIVADFAQSLQTMKQLAAEARVSLLVCAPVSNLADFPPVLGDDPSLAEDGNAAFERGRSRLAAGDLAEARTAFARARDLDRWPHRAGSALLAALRGADLQLVPLDAIFEERSARGVPGFDLFADHCHPTPLGQRLMALSVADALEDLGLFPPTGRRGEAPAVAEALPALGADESVFAQAAAETGRTFTGFALMSGRDGLLADLAAERLQAAAEAPGLRAGEVEANRALVDLLKNQRASAYVHLQACAQISGEAITRLQRLYDDYPWVRAVFDRNGLVLRKGRLSAAKA